MATVVNGISYNNLTIKITGSSRPITYKVLGAESLSGIGTNLDSEKMYGYRGEVVGRTTGRREVKPVELVVPLAEFQQISALYNLEYLSRGYETLTITVMYDSADVTNPNPMVPVGFILTDCMLQDWDLSTNNDSSAVMVTMSLEPTGLKRAGEAVASALSNLLGS